MSATVAAALKKIAVALLTDKRSLKTIGGIVLGIIIIIVMPIAAVLAVFSGGIEYDTDRLQEIMEENLSAEETTMLCIENAMAAAGYSEEQTEKAELLYLAALSDYSSEDGFVEKLVGCFAADQTNEELISAVNAAFGTELSAEELFGQEIYEI